MLTTEQEHACVPSSVLKLTTAIIVHASYIDSVC